MGLRETSQLESVVTPSDSYVGRPVVMERRGCVAAAKGPGQLAKEVLKPRDYLMDFFG